MKDIFFSKKQRDKYKNSDIWTTCVFSGFPVPPVPKRDMEKEERKKSINDNTVKKAIFKLEILSA